MKKTEIKDKMQQHISSRAHGQKWLLTNSYQIIDKQIPTFSEIDSNFQKLKKLKNSKRKLIKGNLLDIEEKVSFKIIWFNIK